MKKLFLYTAFLLLPVMLHAQVFTNPNVAIKPVRGLTIPRVVLTDSTTIVVIRIVNEQQLPPFSIKTRNLKIRKVSDPYNYKLIRAEKAPFHPQKHTFSHLNDILEFTLVFPALPPPVKYFDIIEETPQKDFYIQGIILDPDLNRAIGKGFSLYQKGDREGALISFIDAAEMDLYFEYGMVYFNIIYLLAQMNRWQEARDWYAKFKNRFFFDKSLLEMEFNRMGILSRLQ